ncbi:MAG: hypothetical protein K0U20_09905 [Proteobacteria bacterium]|nr:hypothetical protein [Pseudomonadota bacterium]MCH9735881.1 hypothetical protein [Actinomycetes bacterium]
MSMMHFCSASAFSEGRVVISPDSIDSTLSFGTAELNFTQVSLTNQTIAATRDTSSGESTATALLTLTSDGEAKSAINSVNSDAIPLATDYNSTDWWTGKPDVNIGDDYELFATAGTVSNGGVLTGTFDVWTGNIGPSTYQLQRTGNNIEIFSSVEITISIRDIATQTIQDTAIFTLTADLFGP